MKQLIEDYKRRLHNINEAIRTTNNNGSTNDVKKLERLNTKASEYRTFISELEGINNTPEFLTKIDFTSLRNQKTSLLSAIKYFEDNHVPQISDDLNGILALIDAIQDYAVDEMNMNPVDVYDFEAEERE